MKAELIVGVEVVDPAQHGGGVDAGEFLAVLAHGAVGSRWLHSRYFGPGDDQRALVGRLAERVNQAGMIDLEHWAPALRAPARQRAAV